MLQINNHTPLQCFLGVFANLDGVDCVYGVVKATFAIRPVGVELAPEQVPIILADEYYGDPQTSSLKTASEITLLKPSTDVILQGHAYAPGGRAKQVDVTLKVGTLEKTIRVFGNRVWRSGLLRYKISEPETFERIPLKYEYAFGGFDPEPRNKTKVDYEPRNLVGKGLVPRESRLSVTGVPLPNLEDPKHLIRRPKHRPAPACFGPICAHWAPRKFYTGTYDEEWAKKRAPYLPADFEPRFFQSAPPDLVSTKYLKGGEWVEIIGASPSGRLRFALPMCSLELIFHLDGKEHSQIPKLDTIVFQPDLGRFWMIWRACQVVDKKLLRLRELEIISKEYAEREVA
jgi:hypothetical protein